MNPLPLSAIWLDADGVAAQISVTPRQVRERLACRPDFPQAVREKGVGLRWNAAEVDAWMRERREHTGGRPRELDAAAIARTVDEAFERMRGESPPA